MALGHQWGGQLGQGPAKSPTRKDRRQNCFSGLGATNQGNGVGTTRGRPSALEGSHTAGVFKAWVLGAERKWGALGTGQNPVWSGNGQNGEALGNKTDRGSEKGVLACYQILRGTKIWRMWGPKSFLNRSVSWLFAEGLGQSPGD